MLKNKIFFCLIFFLSIELFAQKSKLNLAWRSLSDYEETLKEGLGDTTQLFKAKQAIDLALTNETTKSQLKTHVYKFRISYAYFQFQLNSEIKNLELSINDKNERILIAYGNTNLTDFEIASNELTIIKSIDPKFINTIQEGISGDISNLNEDDLKFARSLQQMRLESSNIASGKYKVKKYDDAANYYYKTAFINTILSTSKDTANFYNACIAAAKSKNLDYIIDYNKKMIDAKIAISYNYEAIFNAYIQKNDSVSALENLSMGRKLFPDDIGLLTEETNLFYANDKHQEALDNLKISIQKDSTNALYYLFMGNIYDNLANPKNKLTFKELEKPKNFEELFKNAEKNYLKAIQLNPINKDYLYNSMYNLGAMYNNYGGYIENKKLDKSVNLAKYQKENGEKSQEYYKKAIPYLEESYKIKSDDKYTMNALRLLYFQTNNNAKAKEMDEKMKAIK